MHQAEADWSGTMRPKRISSDVVVILVACAVITTLSLHWVRPGALLGYVDFFPDFDPLTLLHKSIDGWGHVKNPFGGYDFPTYAPLYLLAAILYEIVGKSTGQMLIIGLQMCAAWVGIYTCCRSLGLTSPAGVVASTFYALGPEALSTTTWISAGAFLATMPWLVTLIIAGLQPAKRKTSRTMAGLIALTVFPVIGSTPQLFFVLVLATAAFFSFVWAINRRPSDYAKWFLGTALLVFICSLWWILPVCIALFSSAVVHATAPSDVSWTFSNSSILNAFRFITAWTWSFPEYTPYAKSYDANILLYACGFAGAVGLCLAVATARPQTSQWIRFLLVLALLGLFITKGLHGPFEPLNAAVLSLPGLRLLIEPAGATLVTLFAVSLALGFAVEEGLGTLRLRGVSALGCGAAYAAIVVIMLLPGMPLITGKIFTVRGGNASMYVSLPNYWTDAAAFMDSDQTPGSVLILPPNSFYERSYTWGYRGVDLIPASVFKRSTIIPGPSLDYLDDDRLASLILRIGQLSDARSHLMLPMLQSHGVRFVVCRGDVETADGADCRGDLLAVDPRPRRFGALWVAKVPNPRAPFNAWKSWIGGQYGGISPGDLVEFEMFLPPAPRFDINDYRIPGELGLQPAIVEYSSTYTQPEQAPRRVLFTYDMLHNHPTAVSLSNKAKLDVSFSRVPEELPILQFDGFDSRGTAVIKGRVLPDISMVSASSRDYSMNIFNPGDRQIQTDIVIPLEQGANVTLYSGNSRGQRLQTELSNGRLVAHNVVLSPGNNKFWLSGLPQSLARKTRLQGISPNEAIATGAGTFILVGGPQRSYIVTTGIAVNDALSGSDRVSAALTQASQVGVVLQYHRGKQYFICHASLSNDVLLSSAIESCEHSNGVTDPRYAVKIDRVDFDHTSGSKTAIVRSELAQLALFGKRSWVQREIPLRISSDSHLIVQGQSVILNDSGLLNRDRLTQGKAVEVASNGEVQRGVIVSLAPDRLVLRTESGKVASPLYAEISSLHLTTSEPRYGAIALPRRLSNSARALIDLTVTARTNIVLLVLHGSHIAGSFDLAVGRHELRIPANYFYDQNGVLINALEFKLPPFAQAGKIARVELGIMTLDPPFSIGAGKQTAINAKLGDVLTQALSTNVTLHDPNVNDSISALSVGGRAPKIPASEPLRAQTWGSFALLRVDCGRCIITNDQLYTQLWFGLRLGRVPRLLTHMQADLWQNAWIVDTPGQVILFNLVTLLEAAGVLLAIVALTWSAAKR